MAPTMALPQYEGERYYKSGINVSMRCHKPGFLVDCFGALVELPASTDSAFGNRPGNEYGIAIESYSLSRFPDLTFYRSVEREGDHGLTNELRKMNENRKLEGHPFGGVRVPNSHFTVENGIKQQGMTDVLMTARPKEMEVYFHKYDPDTVKEVHHNRTGHYVVGFDRDAVITAAINAGYIQQAPGTVDASLMPTEGRMIITDDLPGSPMTVTLFMKDTTGRFSNLWHTAAGRSVIVPNLKDYNGADGLYVVINSNRKQVINDFVPFTIGMDTVDIEKDLMKFEVYSSEAAMSSTMTPKQVADLEKAREQLKAELEKTKKELDKKEEEVRRLTDELNEVKRLRVRDREGFDDVKSDLKKNTKLDWFKTGMSTFGMEIKKTLYWMAKLAMTVFI